MGDVMPSTCACIPAIVAMRASFEEHMVLILYFENDAFVSTHFILVKQSNRSFLS